MMSLDKLLVVKISPHVWVAPSANRGPIWVPARGRLSGAIREGCKVADGKRAWCLFITMA